MFHSVAPRSTFREYLTESINIMCLTQLTGILLLAWTYVGRLIVPAANGSEYIAPRISLAQRRKIHKMLTKGGKRVQPDLVSYSRVSVCYDQRQYDMVNVAITRRSLHIRPSGNKMAVVWVCHLYWHIQFFCLTKKTRLYFRKQFVLIWLKETSDCSGLIGN